MAHLAEIHITEDLEQHADDILSYAAMIQSHLETSSSALIHVKAICEKNMSMPIVKEEDEEEEEQVDESRQVLEFLAAADSLVSQTRSSKVVAGKAIRELEDLRNRSLTLDTSTTALIKQPQESAAEFAKSIQHLGTTVLKLLAEEGRSTAWSYAELFSALSSDGVSLTSLSSKLHTTNTEIQAFYNLTNSLKQTVEFPSPPPPPPWQLLAQKIRDESAASALQIRDLGRLKEEAADKITAVAVRDKRLEEMSVQVEVLQKRVGESGGRREKVRELESALESSQAREKERSAKTSQLKQAIRALEEERETWKQSAAKQAQVSPQGVDATSTASLARVEALESEISTLQSAIRHLRLSSQRSTFSSTAASNSFLSEPLHTNNPQAPTLMQSEAKDVFKEMLHLVSKADNQMVRLQIRNRADRLKWRPAKETSKWHVGRRREEWEGWREWAEDVGEKAKREAKGLRFDGVKRRSLVDYATATASKMAGEVNILDHGDPEMDA